MTNDLHTLRLLSKTGININALPIAVRDSVWSASVQHKRAATIVEKAINNVATQNIEVGSYEYSVKLINEIYDVRSNYIIENKVKDAQSIVSNRYRLERNDALLMLPK